MFAQRRGDKGRLLPTGPGAGPGWAPPQESRNAHGTWAVPWTEPWGHSPRQAGGEMCVPGPPAGCPRAIPSTGLCCQRPAQRSARTREQLLLPPGGQRALCSQEGRGVTGGTLKHLTTGRVFPLPSVRAGNWPGCCSGSTTVAAVMRERNRGHLRALSSLVDPPHPTPLHQALQEAEMYQVLVPG